MHRSSRRTSDSFEGLLGHVDEPVGRRACGIGERIHLSVCKYSMPLRTSSAPWVLMMNVQQAVCVEVVKGTATTRRDSSANPAAASTLLRTLAVGVVGVPTFNAYSLLHIIIKTQGADDVRKGIEYLHTLKVYPLADAARLRPNRFIDVAEQPFEAVPMYDASFYASLARMVSEETVQERRACKRLPRAARQGDRMRESHHTGRRSFRR